MEMSAMPDSEAKKRWDRENTKQFKMRLNLRTDSDIIQQLENQESVQGYLKRLIRNDMKEEKKMASRAFYTGSMVSSTVLEDMIANMQETADQEEFDRMASNYRQYMTNALESLDDRLWWQPETGEIFWEDDGSDKPLPDPDDFEAWWKETTENYWEA
jgi:hypothetical protein